jgi:hypothetical protein
VPVTPQPVQSRWDEVIAANTRRGVRMRRKFVANRNRNWLLALYFLAAAKSRSDRKLSDLEAHLVRTLRASSVGERLIEDLARAHARTPAKLRSQIFGERFARLDVSDSVTFADLGQFAEQIVLDTLKQPNVRDLDIRKVISHDGPERNPLRVPPADLMRHASSLTRVVMPGPVSPQQAIANKYTIKGTWFRCLEESNESSAHDEVYWLFGSIAKGFQMSMGTHTFTGVDEDEAFQFDPGEGCFWGMDCQPHTFPDGEIGAAASLVEHDHGDQSQILAGWAAAFAGAAGILGASGVAAWVAAVVAAVGGIGGWIISTFDDDPIADKGYSFDRHSINEVISKHGGSYSITDIFSDGDASYRLKIKIARVF